MTFESFLIKELKAIFLYKYLESEKLGYDIGFQRSAFEWIGKHAKEFRKYHGDDL